ncbi:hypothetical protein G6N76_11190 [Rhizobium daejeonense]|uniref:Uncharacterized protein n=1 Tax=Rhizobium daejeonense TaxID=240521 RepID=A0A6M1RSA0_9HYPH|nr:hypothetical protein [Rhizobium daejeonense]NGO64242.1 hypothetical protein [Rhizobium daejeonense]
MITDVIERLHARIEKQNEMLTQLHARNAVLERALPAELHPDTAQLVVSFASALTEKLLAAQKKYGHTNGWKVDDWERDCKKALMKHVMKGDPLDVAAYAAFCWARGWSTTPYRPQADPEDVMIRDFTDFVKQTAPRLHWKIWHETNTHPNHSLGGIDGWQHGFGTQTFGPMPLPDLIAKMKSEVSAEMDRLASKREGGAA